MELQTVITTGFKNALELIIKSLFYTSLCLGHLLEKSLSVNKQRDFEQINSRIKLVLQLRLHLLKYTIQFVYFQKDYTRKKTNFHIEFIYFLYSCIKQNKRELLKIFLNGTRIFINKKI